MVSTYCEFTTDQLENMSLSDLDKLIGEGTLVGRKYILLFLDKKRDYFHQRAGQNWEHAGIMHKIGLHQDPSDTPCHKLEEAGRQSAISFKKLANGLLDKESTDEELAQYALQIALSKIAAADSCYFEEFRKKIMRSVPGWLGMARSLNSNIEIPTKQPTNY